MKLSNKHLAHSTRQQGAVLVIALVFLLIITSLAVTSMREVALDSRITTNLVDQKQLFNAAEAGLSDAQHRTIGTRFKIPGDYSPHTALQPLDALNSCSNSAHTDPCLLDIDPEFAQEFDVASKQKNYSPDTVTNFSEGIAWYALPIPGGDMQGESENPEYGNMLMGQGTFRYEINSQARHPDGGGTVRLRSAIYRIY